MSRSYKKNKILKYAKFLPLQKANQKLRRVNNIRVKLGKEPLKDKELINPYDICDCIWVVKNKEELKGNEKYFRK